MKIIAILGIWAFSLSIAFSATLKVPGEYATIQAAIDVVSDGDRIVVAPGIYEENIDFSGTNFVLTSQDPNDPEIVCATILKPGLTETTEGPRGSIAYKPSGPVVQFTSGEIPDAVLTGFTIMGGKGIAKVHEDNGDEEFYGGGIYCVGASPSIVGNMIIWNGIPDDRDRPVFGGGILCRDSEALITRNTIAYNYATEGAGILVRLGQPIITQNHIMTNEAVWSGGGIACWNSEAMITRNIIMNNYAVVGGGIVLNQGYLTCNVIENNRASEGGGIVLQGTGTVIHNTVVANSADWGGNLSIHSSQYNSQPSQVLNNIIAWANMGGGVLWYDQGEGLSEGLVIQFNAIWQSNKDEAFQRLLWSDQDGTWVAPVSDIWDIHGNIYAEPGFVDRINGDYHLRPDSPCINTGDPQYEPFAGQTDMDGEERIYSYRTDIGADEFVGHILPVAHAGEDQHIAEPNTWITLDGSESRVQDPYTSLLFSWEQISGPNVELIAADSAQTQFIPTIDGTYDFELVVSDNQEYSNSDTVTISVGPEATRAAWVLWPQTDLGNGHAYQAVRFPESVTWDSGNVMSALAGGYLATLTSPEENIFVLDLVNDVDRYWTATSCVARAGPWLGGYQLPGSQNPGEGWVWITGESFDYQAWCSGEPSGTHKGINERG